jgi:parvulin-like peptidyl-prolyl isomerase
MHLPEATVDDKKIIVAKVNGAEITNYALLDMMNRLAAIDQRGSLPGTGEAARSRVLDILVLQEQALQNAERQGLRVEDALIDRTMEQFIRKLGHEEGYTEYLAKNHISAVEFRAQVERSLVIQLILTEEVVKKTIVTDDDLRKEYERARTEYLTPAKVTVIDVFLPLNDGEQTAMARARDLLAALNADKDKDPSHLASNATFSVRVLGLDNGNEPALYEAAIKLKTGELSDTIMGKGAVHLLKLTEYLPGRQMSYEEAKGSLEGKLKTAALIKRRQAWEQELRNNAKIEVLNAPAHRESRTQ